MTSYSIQDLSDDAGVLNPIEFQQKRGVGFLLVFQRSDNRADRRNVSTVVNTNTTSSLEVRVHNLSSDFSWIDCGRTPNNDVVIDDSTVSKLHAWFRLEGDHFVVYDAGSRNGTRVADKKVPVRGQGEGARLANNVGVELGSVRARYLDARMLQQFICTLTQQRPPR